MPALDPHALAQSDALAAVRKVYASLLHRPLVRDCQERTECCQFHLTGKVPHLTRGEALLAAKALRATGRKTLPAVSEATCPLLDPCIARCLIYESRPFGCRTHFCAAAGGSYPRAHVLDLIRRLEEIDILIGGDGSHPLPAALYEALGEK